MSSNIDRPSQTMKIFEAASGNYVNELKQALNEKLDEIPNEELELALLRASKNGHKECVEVLLEKGVNVMARDGQDNTTLIVAAEEGHSEVVNTLLTYGVCINCRNSAGYDALMKACENGHPKVAGLLIENGANDENKIDQINYKLNSYGVFQRTMHSTGNISNRMTGRQLTPLLISILKGPECHRDLIKLLLQRKSAVFDVNAEQNTALHFAAKTCDRDIVEMLINAGADINAKDFYGVTPLMNAASYNRLDITQMLLKYGCDVNITDHMLRSALSIAARNDGAELIDMLLAAGADINQLDAHKNSPLFIAICHKNHSAAKSLVKNGCDLSLSGRHMSTRKVMTFFQLAVWYKDTQMIEILYSAEAFTNRDLWDMYHDGRYSNHCQDQPEVWEYLTWLVRKPRPLISSSRLTILKTCRRPLLDSVDKLSIPGALKEYLKFSDIIL